MRCCTPPLVCALKSGCLDENGENDEFTFYQKRKFSPKTEVFGTSLRTSGRKLRSGPRNPGKQAFWLGHPARTSMKKLRSEKLRADFSFPILPTENKGFAPQTPKSRKRRKWRVSLRQRHGLEKAWFPKGPFRTVFSTESDSVVFYYSVVNLLRIVIHYSKHSKSVQNVVIHYIFSSESLSVVNSLRIVNSLYAYCF